MQNWIVYIIQTRTGQLYTGITTNLERRLKEHQTGNKGAKFFRFSEAYNVVFQETHMSRSDASKREADLKKLTRSQKNELIKSKITID